MQWTPTPLTLCRSECSYKCTDSWKVVHGFRVECSSKCYRRLHLRVQGLCGWYCNRYWWQQDISVTQWEGLWRAWNYCHASGVFHWGCYSQYQWYIYQRRLAEQFTRYLLPLLTYRVFILFIPPAFPSPQITNVDIIYTQSGISVRVDVEVGSSIMCFSAATISSICLN